jgi:hypothetical protein
VTPTVTSRAVSLPLTNDASKPHASFHERSRHSHVTLPYRENGERDPGAVTRRTGSLSPARLKDVGSPTAARDDEAAR